MTLQLPVYQVDAFTERLFAGNPAAVMVLADWLPDATLQAIAAEHNLAETAFVVTGADTLALRWFTPTCEVELCGHATLAAAHVLYECIDGFERSEPLAFETRFAGTLTVSAAAQTLWLDFPALDQHAADHLPEDLTEGLGGAPAEWRLGNNYMAVFDSAQEVAALAPDMRRLGRLADYGVIVTAPGGPTDDKYGCDFVSRYFAPNFGVDEDAVTGSAHCMLAPYWGERLGKKQLAARQLSARGGRIDCVPEGARVRLGGQARLYSRGTIFLDAAMAGETN